MKKISAADLVCMDDFEGKEPLRVETAYARADNLLFGERIYRPEAKLYLHRDLAAIVIEAARLCHARHNLRFILYDGLRTVDAQAAMMKTQRVKDNPHWLEPPRLLSPPGAGGHPRAMAVDIGLENAGGALLDMGTPFDFLAENPHPAHNPAHRDSPGHAPEITANRRKLDECMLEAAGTCGTPLLPLPEEWWDFRLPPETYNAYAPLSESDLPEDMRLLYSHLNE